MTITFDDFERVDMRVGRVVSVENFPEARSPAFKLKIDFGPEVGVKSSSVQAVGAHTREELDGMLVVCVVNFPPKRIADYISEVLTLGFKNTDGSGWVLITPAKDSVEPGDKLR